MIKNDVQLFKNLAMGIFCLFALTMIVVMMTAYLRTSGSTGLDPASIQQIRMQAMVK